MPVRLTVSDIRREILHASGCLNNRGKSPGSTRLLGRIFHESFAQLFMDCIRRDHWPSIANTESKGKFQGWIKEYLYTQIIGPRLEREQVHLKHATEQVVSFWESSKAMCRWTADILWTAEKAGANAGAKDLPLLIRPEESLTAEIRMEGWSDSVLLTGIADLVLRIPDNKNWCVVELKLGNTCPEADLAQACLYHELLSSQKTNFPGALALIRFCPEMEEHLFHSTDLAGARKNLMDLIGSLTGVLPPPSQPPASDMFEDNKPSDVEEKAEEFNKLGEKLVNIFDEYGINVSIGNAPAPGPTFIRYTLDLGTGVRLNKVRKASGEIQHRLRLSDPPYIGISDGIVSLDIQRKKRIWLKFGDIRRQFPEPGSDTGSSLVPVGIDLNGRLISADLAEPEHVHLLVAGSTGSGKSEWLRTGIAGLVLGNSPDTLRLVLIDPKRNAFNEFKDSPFLLRPDALVYPDEVSVADVLFEVADEMDNRYRMMQEAGAETRNEFVRITGKQLPRIVCVCDEYLDLVDRDRSERKKLESQVIRLGAKARAAGIHLIIATQHPSRDVIKGPLDANIPARVALRMNSSIESNMLIRQKGAENLLGKGDLLFKDIGDPVRLQSPLLSPEERRQIFSKQI